VGERIERPAAEVYEYALDPRNLPAWAAGLSGGTVERVDGVWVSDSPMGRVTVAFTPRNDLGVLDHDVTLPNGEVVTNPLRVLADGEHTDIVFSVRHRPDVSSTDFEADVALVAKDLATLKRIVERAAHA
jgi:hypothetical protein